MSTREAACDPFQPLDSSVLKLSPQLSHQRFNSQSMATFVHLAPEKSIKSILRSGINARVANPEMPKGVFAMPVTPNFYVSHQWLRELKRSGQRTFEAVYFKLPDEEVVWVGHYNGESIEVTAAEAVGIILNSESTEGYEVFIPRKVSAKEIHRTKRLPQVLGWRYFPGAKGRRPCGCPVCQPRGEIKSQRIRKAYEEDFL